MELMKGVMTSESLYLKSSFFQQLRDDLIAKKLMSFDDINNDDNNTFQNAFSAKALALDEADSMVEIRICI